MKGFIFSYHPNNLRTENKQEARRMLCFLLAYCKTDRGFGKAHLFEQISAF
jgi:hypothetical protein